MSKKITKREKFEMLKAIPSVAQNEMLVEFIDHELTLLAKKNSSDKKPTAQQIATDRLKGIVYEVLKTKGEKGATITDIMKSHEELADLSNQRVSSLTRKLMDDGKVERFEEKRKAMFKVIA